MNANARSHADYIVGWVCALPQEQTAAIAMLDEVHESLSKPPTDTNAYTLGSIGQHNIVIACLPKGYAGQNSVATVATQMVQTFSSIKIGLLVGIGGGIPPKVRLGDVVVSTPDGQFPGVVQWDLGKSMEGGKFERTGSLNNPPNSLLSALGKLESKHELEGSKISDFLKQFKEKHPLAAKTYLDLNPLRDLLFTSSYMHVEVIRADNTEDGDGASDDEEEQSCVSCDPSQIIRRKNRSMRIHYGLIASSNTKIEDAKFRDGLNKELDGKVLCVEMEAGGLMNNFPCIVIRGICNYADSHRNKTWQKYAAAVAAAFAKELLSCVQSSDVEGERPIRDILNEVKDELNQISRDIESGFGETRKGLDNLIKVQTVKEQNKALSWLSSIDSASMHHDYIKKCEPRTGRDLLNSEKLKQWINTPQTALFCSGIPGAGKTFQTAILINHLINEFQHNDTIGLAYFYYRFDRQEIQKPEQLISNLIKQLGQNHEPSREQIQKFYEGHKMKGSRPLIKELVDLLEVITALLSRAYVVIDALDECDDNDYSRTRLLDSLFAAQKKGLNICATSRSVQIIEQKFEGAMKWQVTPSENDIFLFLDRRMAQLPDFVQSNILLQEEIKKSIKSAIEGMFLLAQMYIDSLVGKRSIASVRRALEGLKIYPKERDSKSDALSKAYHKAIERIQQQKGDLPADAMTILAWVVKAKKPLPVSTLRLILAIDIEKSRINEDNFPTADHITQACAPLVVIESKTQEARLAHYTIQEYLERPNNIWMENSQTLIASTCMSYLSFSGIQSFFKNARYIRDNFKNGERFPYLPRGPSYRHGPSYDYGLASFSSYAMEFWAYHTKEALAQGLEVQRVVHFLNNRTKLDLWHDFLMQIDLARTNYSVVTPDELLQTSEQVVGLHVSACLGLTEVLAELIKKGCNPDVRDEQDRSPLWWAAFNGHTDIAKLLLEQNVDIEVKDKTFYRTPLNLAAKRGSVAIVELLLDKGADLESGDRDTTFFSGMYPERDYTFDEDFRKAVSQPHPVERYFYNFRNLTPLQLAMENRHERVSELLINRGSKIKNSNRFTQPALHVAISFGWLTIVELLLSLGENVEMRDMQGSTALQIAAMHGQPKIAKFLLSKGADIKNTNKDGQTALQIAINHFQPKIAKFLLSKGADIKNADKDGRTALHIAAASTDVDLVKLLLIHNAHTETRDKDGCTALHFAARFNQFSVIEVLLTQGADIEAKNEYGETALITASKCGSQAATNVLIKHGADIAACDYTGRSVLSWAKASSLWPTVELLFSKGFAVKEDVEFCGGRMLHMAIDSHDFWLLDWLLKHNVDANYYDTVAEFNPLQRAVERGNAAIVSRLLEIDGIDTRAREYQGFDLLTLAVRSGNKKTAALLIQSGKVHALPGQERFFEFVKKSYCKMSNC